MSKAFQGFLRDDLRFPQVEDWHFSPTDPTQVPDPFQPQCSTPPKAFTKINTLHHELSIWQIATAVKKVVQSKSYEKCIEMWHLISKWGYCRVHVRNWNVLELKGYTSSWGDQLKTLPTISVCCKMLRKWESWVQGNYNESCKQSLVFQTHPTT